MKKALILNWQPEKKLTKAFLTRVSQGIEQRRRWLEFWRGLGWALIAGFGLLNLIIFGWLIKDLYLGGFFLTLTRPDLYFSLTGLDLISALIPWENLLLLTGSLWLFELLLKKQGRSNYGSKT